MLTTTILSIDRTEPNKLDRRVQIDLTILGLSYITTPCYAFPASASWLMSYCATPCSSTTRQSALLVASITLASRLAFRMTQTRQRFVRFRDGYYSILTMETRSPSFRKHRRSTLANSRTDSNPCGVLHLSSIEDQSVSNNICRVLYSKCLTYYV